jgi:hypothetical protein
MIISKNLVRHYTAIAFVGYALAFGNFAKASSFCTADATVTRVEKAPDNQPHSYLVYVDISASRSDFKDVFIKFDADNGDYHSHNHVIETKFSGTRGQAKGITFGVPDDMQLDASTITITSVNCHQPN